MWTRQQLKANAKLCLRRFHWHAVLVCLIISLLCGTYDTGIEFNLNLQELDLGADLLAQLSGSVSGNGILGYLFCSATSTVILLFVLFAMFSTLAFSWLISNVIEVGGHRYFLIARERPASVTVLFVGFQYGYRNIVLAMLLRAVYIFLWSLLFLIPGIVKAYAYRMVPYLLAENPHMEHRRALELSEAMMKGHKFDTFLFDLSFLGWELLNFFTGNLLNVLYLQPYMAAAHTEHYCAVRAEAFAHGLTDLTELPGFAADDTL